MSDAAPLGDLRFHRLLVALDGSANAELALRVAVTAAERDHAAITLVSVATTATEAVRWPGPAVDLTQLQDEIDAEATRVLQDAVERMPAEIPVHTVVRHGRPGPEIVALADSGEFDAVLLGARGVGRVAALIGSVSAHVLHHVQIAAFVARAPRSDGGP